MGKGKKRKAPLAGRDAQQQEPENLFERLSNKKRFDIMGRKVKGETKQVGKLRSAATERVSGGDGRESRFLPHSLAQPSTLPTCSARTPCWLSTASCARATRSSTAALEVREGCAWGRPASHYACLDPWLFLLVPSACMQRTTRT